MRKSGGPDNPLVAIALSTFAEAKRSDELRKAEDAKRADDLRVAQEEMRKAQAALKSAQADREAALKAGEEARKDAASKLASLPSNASAAKQMDAPTRDPAALASSLQKELKRVGCDPGSLDGTWGPKAKQALAEFARVTKLSVPLDQPSDSALEVVSLQKGKDLLGIVQGGRDRSERKVRTIRKNGSSPVCS